MLVQFGFLALTALLFYVVACWAVRSGSTFQVKKTEPRFITSSPSVRVVDLTRNQNRLVGIQKLVIPFCGNSIRPECAGEIHFIGRQWGCRLGGRQDARLCQEVGTNDHRVSELDIVSRGLPIVCISPVPSDVTTDWSRGISIRRSISIRDAAAQCRSRELRVSLRPVS